MGKVDTKVMSLALCTDPSINETGKTKNRMWSCENKDQKEETENKNDNDKLKRDQNIMQGIKFTNNPTINRTKSNKRKKRILEVDEWAFHSQRRLWQPVALLWPSTPGQFYDSAEINSKDISELWQQKKIVTK